MQIVFIRHAQAVEADQFAGPDHDRPLTPAGRRRAERAYRRLPRILENPGRIVHSAARRAVAAADLLAEPYPRARRVEDPALNPGATPAAVRRVIRRWAPARGSLVLVGHEPDFSAAIAALTGGRCRLRKGAVAVVASGPGARLELLLGLDELCALRRP